MIKNQFGLFLFLKAQNYSLTSAKEENYLRCQFNMGILRHSVRTWNSSQNRESNGKIVKFDRSVKVRQIGIKIPVANSNVCSTI